MTSKALCRYDCIGDDRRELDQWTARIPPNGRRFNTPGYAGYPHQVIRSAGCGYAPIRYQIQPDSDQFLMYGWGHASPTCSCEQQKFEKKVRCPEYYSPGLPAGNDISCNSGVYLVVAIYSYFSPLCLPWRIQLLLFVIPSPRPSLLISSLELPLLIKPLALTSPDQDFSTSPPVFHLPASQVFLENLRLIPPESIRSNNAQTRQ
ncbi:hypothetical protein BJX99DRAFT_202363 [Aspergillus californicus]